MAREEWWCAGYQLTQGLVRDVEVRDGLHRVADVRGEDTELADRHGGLWRPRALGTGAFALQLWLGADTRPQLEGALDELLRAVYRPRELLLWERQLAGGSRRQALGYVSEGPDPQSIGQLGMRLALAVTIPSGRWRSSAEADTGALPVAASGDTVELQAFAAQTAPADDLRVVLTGGGTDVRVADARTGRGFRVRGALPAGGVTVDAASWTVTGAPVGQLEYDGPTFLELQAGHPTAGRRVPALTVTGANLAGLAVRVVGRPAFLA